MSKTRFFVFANTLYGIFVGLTKSYKVVLSCGIYILHISESHIIRRWGMADFYEKLKLARVCELEIGVQLEHIERLHRIVERAAGGSAEYAGSVAEKLAALERELNEQIDKTVDAKRGALVYLSSLGGEERAVMESYFFLGKDWARIAVDLSMSERRVFLLRKSAMNKLEKLYGEPTEGGGQHKTVRSGHAELHSESIGKPTGGKFSTAASSKRAHMNDLNMRVP